MTPVAKYLPVLQDAVADYQKEHPHWRIEVLVSLIKWGLTSLKHYIEDSPDGRITWEEPWVELHYPVDWNWQPRREGDITFGGHIFGTITKQNTASKARAARTLGEIMVRQINATALADATNWAWYEKHNDYYTPFLPLELGTGVQAIKDKRKQREVFDDLVRPFSIGAASIGYGAEALKDGARLPKSITRQLAHIGEMMDIPRIALSGEINGRMIEMALVFQIHPLLADYDQKKAYHAVTVGLFIEPRVIGKEIVTTTPADWPRHDRETLWTELLQAVDQLVGKLVPEFESQESVILSVNAQLKVPADCWRPENRSATIAQICAAQAQAGEVEGLSVHPAGIPPALQPQAACAVCGWQHDTVFTHVRVDTAEVVSLRGVLPQIVGLVHRAHEEGYPGLSTKDEELLKTCGGYRNPCKAFDDLKQRAAYKMLFDTSRRGFISLRGAVGRNRNKSAASPE